jgi:hypothetical protein
MFSHKLLEDKDDIHEINANVNNIFSTERCADVAKHKWKVHNGKFEIISVVMLRS